MDKQMADVRQRTTGERQAMEPMHQSWLGHAPHDPFRDARSGRGLRAPIESPITALLAPDVAGIDWQLDAYLIASTRMRC
jgi:hypothetical protein